MGRKYPHVRGTKILSLNKPQETAPATSGIRNGGLVAGGLTDSPSGHLPAPLPFLCPPFKDGFCVTVTNEERKKMTMSHVSSPISSRDVKREH